MTYLNLVYFSTITFYSFTHKSDIPAVSDYLSFYASRSAHMGTTFLQGLYGKIPLILQVIMTVWKHLMSRHHTSMKHFWPHHSTKAELIHLPSGVPFFFLTSPFTSHTLIICLKVCFSYENVSSFRVAAVRFTFKSLTHKSLCFRR